MKLSIHRLILLFAAIALTASAGIAARAKSAKAPAAADIKKAEYLYLEAVDAYEDNRIDDYYMLVRRAARLNPSDPFIAAALGELEMTLPTADSLMRERAYAGLADRFDAMPTDDHNASSYASAAAMMGRMDDVVDVWARLDSLMPARTDPAMNLATSLMGRYSTGLDTADFNRAIAIFDRLERAIGPNMPLTARKVGAFALRKDTSAIVESLHALAESAPADIPNNLFVGQVFQALAMPDSAMRYYDKAQAVDPDNGNVYLSRANLFHQLGDSVAYDREVFRALQSSNVEFADKFRLLSDYVLKIHNDSTQRPRIVKMFDTLQEVNPGEADLHGLYGAYIANLGDLEGAAEQFSYSTDLDPGNESVWNSLIGVYSQLRDYSGMLTAARKALVYFPGHASYALVASNVLAYEGRLDEALAELDSIDMDGPLTKEGISAIYGSRGDLLYRLGRTDDAINAYTKAIDANPENYMALNNCAYFMAEDDRDLDRAELYSSISTAAEPDNPTFLDTYAWIFFKKKDYERAKELIDKTLAQYGLGDNPDAAPEPAEIPAEELPEQSEVEIVEPESTIEISADVYEHAGDIYFMCGYRPQAFDFWKKALELDPDNENLRLKIESKSINPK